MNRIELTAVVAAAFMVAVLLGWLLHWLYGRLGRVGLENSPTTNDLAARLHDAEEARDAAFRDRDESITEMKKKLVQTEAELSAAMEGLGDARRDVDALRRELEASRG